MGLVTEAQSRDAELMICVVPSSPIFKCSPGDSNAKLRLRTTALENPEFISLIQINT